MRKNINFDRSHANFPHKIGRHRRQSRKICRQNSIFLFKPLYQFKWTHCSCSLTAVWRAADCSRLRLAAACGMIKIAQEPHYIEYITLENFQRLSLVMQVKFECMDWDRRRSSEWLMLQGRYCCCAEWEEGLCNFNMKLVGTITLDNFVMGERHTLCTSHYLSPGGGGRRWILGGYQSSLTQYKDFNLKTIEK